MRQVASAVTDSGTGNPNPNTPWMSKLLKLTPK
jgi:hypothetical protein